MAFRYTADMKAFLKKGYLTLDYMALTVEFNAEFGLNKRPEQVRSAIRNFGYRSGPDKVPAPRATYPDNQLNWLREHYPLLTITKLTPAFNAAFGTDKTEAQIFGCVKRYGIKSGRTGNFQKGHVPVNKGKKGPPPKGKQLNTIFKKGQAPRNKKPIGHERIDSQDGYVYVKTDQKNPWTGAQGWYRQKHVVTWEQHNGPVPKGHCVLLKDGNKQNCSDINNLMLVTRGQLAQLNKTKLINAPAELKEAALVTVDIASQLRWLQMQKPGE